MKSTTLSALFFAASIALAVAYPRNFDYYDEDYPEGKALISGRPISLASAPFYYQPRTLELEERGRKYKIVKKKKHPGGPPQGSDEDDAQDDEGSDESSEEDEEEDDENNNENNDEESLDVPPWESLFPEEDKNTGTFQDQPGGGAEGGYGGQGGPSYGGAQGGGYGGGQGGSSGYGGGQSSLANLPTGGPAPESSGSLMSALFGGSSFGGGQSGGDGPQGGGGGGPPQYRQGPPPPYQAVRARTSLPSSLEEPRSGGAVLYDGYRYIPVKPVHVRVPKRQAKKIKTNTKVTPEKEGRSLRTSASSSTRQTKKPANNKQQQYVLVPVGRNNREIRFNRDQHSFNIDSAPAYGPSEVWRWEGPGGRPLRRRENRPSGLYYAPRPQRGSASTIRFAEENDY